MPKVRKPADVDVVMPDKPPLNTDLDDEDDDEHIDQLSDEGMLSAADDLSVIDFFAGCAVISVTRTYTDPEAAAKRAYEIAEAMVLERARRDGSADGEDEDEKT